MGNWYKKFLGVWMALLPNQPESSLSEPSVVTVSKCFLSVGFGRFCRKNLGFRFGLGFHDKCVVNFFMTRVVWHDFHHR